MTASTDRGLLILVAGPYRSCTNDDEAKIAENYLRMNEAALQLFLRGHTPLTGEAIALPLIELAGSKRIGDAPWNEIFHPIGRRLITHVDAVLRIEGRSTGADEMVELARVAGKPVFFNLSEIPQVADLARGTLSHSSCEQKDTTPKV
jgi:hypothetical protein